MAKEIHVRIKRQAGPDAKSYWEEFKMPYESGHNCVSVLMYLREHPVNAKGEKVEPVVWESNCMEEVCGACAMIVNGTPRQACAALIDELQQPIVLEPLTKFPIVRDLQVDRQAMFDALLAVKAWVPIDGTQDIHRHAPLISPKEQDIRYLFSRCMSCGCCLEVCPQYRKDARFIGPAALGQVRLHNSHPTGGFFKEDRLHVLMEPGGIADCGNAQNCVKICPKDIPLTSAIGELGRQTTIQWLRDLFVK
ncbi:MAG: succinate dehydrogenase iron-sulfur subunit [Phycisphaerales bacterium]|nr:succinate dehydrogenase iron-sulfur subunit [Phycisphaerales bacterium]